METRIITPSGIVEVPLPEDDSLPVARLLEPRAPRVDHSALWRRVDEIAAQIDASAPQDLEADRHGMLTAAELARWS